MKINNKKLEVTMLIHNYITITLRNNKGKLMQKIFTVIDPFFVLQFN